MDKAMTGAGSMPTREQRQVSVTKFADLNESQRQQFIEGKPWIGMSTTQLSTMWGNEPAKTQNKLTARGNETIELYKIRVGDWKTGIKTQYFKVSSLEGKVLELQELDETVGTLDKL